MLQPRQKSRRVKSAKGGSSDSEAETTDDENIDMHPIVKEITNQGWFPKKYKKSRFRNVAGIVAAFRGRYGQGHASRSFTDVWICHPYSQVRETSEAYFFIDCHSCLSYVTSAIQKWGRQLRLYFLLLHRLPKFPSQCYSEMGQAT